MYIVECRDGTLYTGITNDLSARLALHDANNGAKYTRGRGPSRLVYSEPAVSRGAATRRELAIKRLTRRAKLALIRAAPPRV